jgi:hypothetical protein
MFQVAVTQAPWIGFICGCLSVFGITLRYNLRTASLVIPIQAIAYSEGRNWVFWGDRNKLITFVWRPGDLLEASDSPPLHAAKSRLLQHRHTLWRWLIVGWLCMVAGPALGILAMILFANR